MAFTGFAPEILTFYEGLEADNSRTYWLAHKPFYDEHVRGAMLALGEALGDRFQPVHVFRPNRDVRFSKDKTLYKTQCGAVHEREGGAINYVAVSAKGLFVGTGMYQLAKDQLERFRTALADDHTGPAFVDAVQQAQQAKVAVGPGAEPPLKRAPKGIAVDHPRIEWLRWKGAIASKDFGTPAWIHTAKAIARIRETWDAAEPLNRWLEAHVGPSHQAPPEADAF
ncbi:MAG: DUF2461 domain-containing protein [Acidimicrobiales bacterium]